jgi:hypothetical protein
VDAVCTQRIRGPGYEPPFDVVANLRLWWRQRRQRAERVLNGFGSHLPLFGRVLEYSRQIQSVATLGERDELPADAAEHAACGLARRLVAGQVAQDGVNTLGTRPVRIQSGSRTVECRANQFDRFACANLIIYFVRSMPSGIKSALAFIEKAFSRSMRSIVSGRPSHLDVRR